MRRGLCTAPLPSAEELAAGGPAAAWSSKSLHDRDSQRMAKRDAPLRSCRFFLSPVPIDGAPQAFFKVYLWLVSQMFLRPRQIGKRMLHISRALRAVLHY